ncbi:chromate transporter-domain-containing protein [Elsinoe ampelina]|uniref:Chromate transporter-domain-containing protein n=1 Tax=Elsinoe ampelina TaxID=302913 RepID=A0A6A6G9U3_9PEZI|nr:chromate transporter-domain-containing protein [Elsinoe ampelina]
MSSTGWTALISALKSRHNALFPAGEPTSKTPVVDMLAHNWYLGFTSFGGPTVHFQIFRELFVDKYQWIDVTTFQEMFALCQALSGPGSTKMIYAINILRYGFWTGFLSFFVWSFPMAIAAFGLALGVGNIGDQLPGPAYALLSGLNSATLSRKAVTDKLSLILVFVGGSAGMLYNALWYFPVLMVAGGTVTIVVDLKLFSKLRERLHGRGEDRDPESPRLDQSVPMQFPSQGPSTGSVHNTHTNSSMRSIDGPAPEAEEATAAERQDRRPSGLVQSWKIGASIIAAFIASFTVIMVCRGLYGGEERGFDLFANLYLAGTIIFGGGPVVIPLLREYIVSPSWVSPRDFLLGLAITQAFPGPNFNFAVYLGALAVKGSNVPAAIGAVIGYVAMFTPGLWLHTGFMGIWSTVRKLHAVRACLRGVHATAVGLIFTAIYRLFQIGYLDSEVQSGGSLSRDPWWVVIVATSYIGGMHFKLTPPLAIITGATMGLVWYAVART